MMRYNESVRRAALVLWLLVFAFCSVSSFAAEKPKQTKEIPKPSGTARLWQDPGDIASKDLYWGIGSPASAPKPPFQFIKEDLSGSNPKVEVTDAGGVKWGVKFESSTNEVHSEVAAGRILWSLGYMVDETYFVPSGRIEGIGKLKREKNSSLRADGNFTNARFKNKSPARHHLGYQWKWDDNPFAGTRELSGLKILMTMLNNWDTKSSNNDIIETKKESGEIEDWYIISDLGATFGKMAVLPMNKNRWDLEDFRRQKFIDRYLNNGNEIKLHYRGKASVGVVPTEHARWFANLAGQLSEPQFRKAFEAAGATPAEINGFSTKLMEKIRELQAYAGMKGPGAPQMMPTKEVELKVKMTKKPN
ncbi:MAG TPA: hypothetical protein VGK99_02205 [Acidobacteriota bacterium]|jgi:hypothetical protein